MKLFSLPNFKIFCLAGSLYFASATIYRIERKITLLFLFIQCLKLCFQKGKKQIFQLGETLLVRYGSFLGAYSAQTVRVDSSDHERCLQSAAIMLAALFPPKAEQVWNENLLWQPIPVHTAPLALDKVSISVFYQSFKYKKRCTYNSFR